MPRLQYRDTAEFIKSSQQSFLQRFLTHLYAGCLLLLFLPKLDQLYSVEFSFECSANFGYNR